jgi:VanZ family protein
MTVLDSVWGRVSAWYDERPGWCRWVPVVLWMAMIFFLSAQPQLPSAPSPFWDDLLKKGSHALEYAVLGTLVWFAVGRRWPLLAWVLAVAYAISDEYHQSFVPGRHPDPVDVGFDALGAALAVFLLWWRGRARRGGLPEGGRRGGAH